MAMCTTVGGWEERGKGASAQCGKFVSGEGPSLISASTNEDVDERRGEGQMGREARDVSQLTEVKGMGSST